MAMLNKQRVPLLAIIYLNIPRHTIEVLQIWGSKQSPSLGGLNLAASFRLNFTRFYHVLPCSTMFYHILPCSTMLYHVLPPEMSCWWLVDLLQTTTFSGISCKPVWWKQMTISKCGTSSSKHVQTIFPVFHVFLGGLWVAYVWDATTTWSILDTMHVFFFSWQANICIHIIHIYVKYSIHSHVCHKWRKPLKDPPKVDQDNVDNFANEFPMGFPHLVVRLP